MQSFKFISFLVFKKNRGEGGFTPFPQAEKGETKAGK